MEQDIKAPGKKTSSMEEDLKHGLTVHLMKVIMSKERNMELVALLGLMVPLILVNS